MNEDLVLELIKACAFGMSDEDIANEGDLELEDVEKFKKKYSKEIKERMEVEDL